VNDNRIIKAVTRIKTALENASPDGIAKCEEAMTIDDIELAHYQQQKSLAVASGALSIDEGMYMYKQMGESASVFNGRPLAVRVAIIQTMGELLS